MEQDLRKSALQLLLNDRLQGPDRFRLDQIGKRIFKEPRVEVELLEGMARLEVLREGAVSADGGRQRSFIGKGEVADGGLDGGVDAALGGFAPACFSIRLVVHLVHDALKVERGTAFIVETGNVIVASGLMGQNEVGDNV